MLYLIVPERIPYPDNRSCRAEIPGPERSAVLLKGVYTCLDGLVPVSSLFGDIDSTPNFDSGPERRHCRDLQEW